MVTIMACPWLLTSWQMPQNSVVAMRHFSDTFTCRSWKKEDGILLVNPGSLAFPRQRGRRPSYAVLETDGNGGMDVEIRYL